MIGHDPHKLFPEAALPMRAQRINPKIEILKSSKLIKIRLQLIKIRLKSCKINYFTRFLRL